MTGFKALGDSQLKTFQGFETFTKPDGVYHVRLCSDEVTAVCPATGQPDYYTVTVDYRPGKLCVESKTVKLYFQTLRAVGRFCEALAGDIARDFATALQAEVDVAVQQKSRGGVVIVAKAQYDGR